MQSAQLRPQQMRKGDRPVHHAHAHIAAAPGRVRIAVDDDQALALARQRARADHHLTDRKSTRLNSSHQIISYAVFCLKKNKHAGARRHMLHSANALRRKVSRLLIVDLISTTTYALTALLSPACPIEYPSDTGTHSGHS